MLLEGAKEAEGQGLAGQQVVSEALDMDESADLSVCDLALDERDQGGVDQVDAGPTDAVATRLPRRRERPLAST